MSQKSVTLFYHWGGHIVPDDVLGVTYEGGTQGVRRLKVGTKYNKLVRSLYDVTGMNSAVEKMVLSCRFPTFVSDDHCTFMQMLVDDDDSVDAMLSVVLEHTQLCAMYLFIDSIPIEPAQNTEYQNPPIHQNEPYYQPHFASSSQNTEYQNQPIHESEPNYSSYNPYEQNYASSSQYTNPQYEQPINYSSTIPDTNPNADCVEHIPHTSLSVVVELVENTGGNNSSDNDNTDGSNKEEMAQVESEIEELGGRGVGTSANPSARLYTPLDYYTNPQEDTYAEDHDWETPPDYRNRTMFDPKSHNLKKGLLFRSKEDLQEAVKMFHIHTKREYTVRISNKTGWEVSCLHANTGCVWKLRGSIQRKHKMWEIVTYPAPHTCVYPSLTTDHVQISSKMIARVVARLVKNDPSYKISSIIVHIHEQFSFTVGYYKAWSAKQKAIAMIFGDWESSYQMLPKFLGAVIAYNPGSVMRYKTLDIGPRLPNTEVLDRVFFSFKPCIDGWRSCRPMICIDATHLYGRYKGKILIAIGKDANRQIYPLAFAMLMRRLKAVGVGF